MREARLGEYTLRSHGFKIAKSHWRDWVILVLLFALEGFLNLINPFHRYVDKYAMNDLKYPLHDTTVPMWAVPIVVVLLPAIIFLGIYYRKRDAYDLHHALLGLLFSIGMTAVITDALKDAAGRPRPDFFWRCFPDGKELYDPVTGNVICHGKASVVKQGYKSFPSGHTSWSFAGLTFLSLYLSGKIEAFDRKGHVAKLCIVFLPLLVATVIGISLVDDYWHHWQDVVVGGLIGLIMAAFCYLQFFPAPYHIEGWRTYAHCRMLEETCATTNTSSVRNQQPEAGNNLSTPGARNGETPLEDLESGRT